MACAPGSINHWYRNAGACGEPGTPQPARKVTYQTGARASARR